MSIKKWQPWEDFKLDLDLSSIKISEPPCKHCKFWKPHRIFRHIESVLFYDGIVCCIADEQHFDFSCFKPIEQKPQKTDESQNYTI